MSDSEYNKGKKTNKGRRFDSDDEEVFSKNKKELSKKRVVVEDSDSDSSITGSKPAAKKHARTAADSAEANTGARNKKSATASKAKADQRGEAWRALDSESEDEETYRRYKEGALVSVYTKRVADGNVCRTAQLEGDLYVDLKLYQVGDIKDIDPKKRYEKSVLQLKFQTDHDAPDLDLLRKYLKRCKAHFTDEGRFYADKNKKKE